jgi:molecular chaperone GrpE (heat shock protein)
VRYNDSKKRVVGKKVLLFNHSKNVFAQIVYQNTDNYRKEVAMLQNRLQAAEARQEELAFLGNEANKPLLRQIEALQNQYNSSLKDWENLEKRYLCYGYVFIRNLTFNLE